MLDGSIILSNFEWWMNSKAYILGKKYAQNKLLPWKSRTT